MTLYPLFDWIQNTDIGTSIRQSLIFFPVVEGIHVISLSLSVGLVLITDLRLIGVLMPDERPADVTGAIKRWMLAGFALMFSSGLLLFWAEAGKLYGSPAFRFKMLFLLLTGLNALFFESTIGRQAVSWHAGMKLSSRARFAGWASLVCWACVIALGRWTAYGLK